MEMTELLIQLKGNKMDSSLIVDGVVTQRAALGKNGGEALIAWLEERTTDRVHARLHVSGSSEMRLALELASMLAHAGHTISVGEVCRFMPVKPVENEGLT